MDQDRRGKLQALVNGPKRDDTLNLENDMSRKILLAACALCALTACVQ